MLRGLLTAHRQSFKPLRVASVAFAREMANSAGIPKLSEVGAGPTATTAVNEAPDEPKVAETSKSAGASESLDSARQL